MDEKDVICCLDEYYAELAAELELQELVVFEEKRAISLHPNVNTNVEFAPNGDYWG